MDEFMRSVTSFFDPNSTDAGWGPQEGAMAAHTGAHTRGKRRGQKKEAQRIPYRLEKLDVLDLGKKMELFEDGKVYRLVVAPHGEHPVLHFNRAAKAYFGLNPDIPGDVPEIFARATRKERIAKLKSWLSNGQSAEKDFKMFFQPFSPDPDNRNLPVLCAVKLEPLLNRKNRHCCSILHLTYQSEITQDMELFCIARNSFAHMDPKLKGTSGKTDFETVQGKLSNLQLALAEHEASRMYDWMEKDVYWGQQAKTSIVVKKAENRNATSEFRPVLRVSQSKLFSDKYRIIGQTCNPSHIPDGVMRPLIRPAQNDDGTGRVHEQLIQKVVQRRAREVREREEQTEMQSAAGRR